MQVMDAISEICLKREGSLDPVLRPDDADHRGRGRGRAAAGDLPAGAGRRPLGRRLRAGAERQRLTQGVFAMQYGPGAENAFAGIASSLFGFDARCCSMPLQRAAETAQMFPLFNSTRSYASVTKQVEPVGMPEYTVAAMRRAFNALKNGRSGPVMVEVPTDVMTAELPGNDVHYERVRRTRSAGDESDIAEAVKSLVDAKCPMIVAGQGVLYGEDLRRAPGLRRADRRAGDDDDRRQELLPRGPCAGAGLGRHGLYRSRPTFPAGIRSRLRGRDIADQAQHLDPDRAPRASASSTPPTMRATSTRPILASCRSWATPSWCSNR